MQGQRSVRAFMCQLGQETAAEGQSETFIFVFSLYFSLQLLCYTFYLYLNIYR